MASGMRVRYGWRYKIRRTSTTQAAAVSSPRSRLESIIPLFRGENARTRGLDPANVRAFDDPPVLDLPPVDEQMGLAEPAEFTRLRDELTELGLRLAGLAPRLRPRESAAAA